MAAWSRSIIDRPLTLLKGKLGVQADIGIGHASITILGMTSSATSEALLVGAGYGISDKLTAGLTYALTLSDGNDATDFSAKGPLTLYGSFSIMHNEKLDVGASAGLVIDLGGVDAMGGSTTDFTVEAGLGVRYKVTPKIAVFTGSPMSPGLLGQHLQLGLAGDNNKGKSFDLPLGVAMQATPELFAYLSTNLASINLGDVPMGGSRVVSYGDVIPVNLGAWYSVNKNIDAGAAFSFPDLGNAGDFYAITVGARYFN